MNDVEELIALLENLKGQTAGRGSQQGIATFEAFIQQLKTSDGKPEDSITGLLLSIDRNLAGIEAHGHFSDEEYAIVQSIRDLIGAQRNLGRPV